MIVDLRHSLKAQSFSPIRDKIKRWSCLETDASLQTSNASRWISMNYLRYIFRKF